MLIVKEGFTEEVLLIRLGWNTADEGREGVVRFEHVEGQWGLSTGRQGSTLEDAVGQRDTGYNVFELEWDSSKIKYDLG